MPLYCTVTDAGDVTDIREIEGEVSTTKLAQDGGPRVRPYTPATRPDPTPGLEYVSASYLVTQESVTQIWTTARLSAPVQSQAVKDESGVRIYTPYPQWKQANMQALGLSLIDKKLTGELTTQEQAALDALYAVWGWIVQVRVASDALEAMDPIPLDYTADSYWPSNPPPAPTV
jgi:hypothetical protein